MNVVLSSKQTCGENFHATTSVSINSRLIGCDFAYESDTHDLCLQIFASPFFNLICDSIIRMNRMDESMVGYYECQASNGIGVMKNAGVTITMYALPPVPPSIRPRDGEVVYVGGE